MSHLTPISTYNLALKPFQPEPAIAEDYPITIRLTLASLDPEADDDKAEPSTLRILKKTQFHDEDDEDDVEYDEDDDEDDDDEDDDDEEDELDETVKTNGSKEDIEIDEEEEDEDEDDDEDDEDDVDIDEDEDEEDISEYVVCTLSPKHQFQQTLDLTITPEEEVYFVVTGSYPIHLTGNYVIHPGDETDEEDEDYDEINEYDDEYDLTPDEDEIIHGINFNEEYDDEEDSEDDFDREESAEPGKIEEIKDDEEEETKPKKRSIEESKEPKESKKSKKSKNNDSSFSNDEKKSVQFSKNLEQGPTGSTLINDKKKDKDTTPKSTPTKQIPTKESKESKSSSKDSTPTKDKKNDKKFPTHTLLGGVITEDRKIGEGPTAKSNNKVGIRYIGKLKNGKVFDKNTNGKPFSFKLGKGECIKGFDLGVTGMSVGGERRVIIPPKMGYGSQSLPGIPANSELTFDIKLVSLK
ncbi:FPR3 [Candida pseudojiufengensis]|uniref:FPR3 n=1 Tax=Candida pseudojiufengensis TaxID=497109 RepID=UPI002224832E|nr:FPR3 [Candida pseudojiufengensis]KAI5961254.1 FPR3 [Candida pseudojiufengensis]